MFYRSNEPDYASKHVTGFLNLIEVLKLGTKPLGWKLITKEVGLALVFLNVAPSLRSHFELSSRVLEFLRYLCRL